MTPTETAHALLPEAVPTAVVAALALVCLAGWVGVHLALARGRLRVPRGVGFALRTLVGFVALVATAEALGRWLVFATNWPLWPIALVGALAIETVLALYALERRTVSRRTGLALAALRVGMIAVVVAMLAQPVRPWESAKTRERYVAVLLDVSPSMAVADTAMPAAERLRLAAALGVEGIARPADLGAAAAGLAAGRDEVAALAEWLAGLRGTDTEDQAARLAERRHAALETLAGVRGTVGRQVDALQAVAAGGLDLDDEAVDALAELATRLASTVDMGLADLAARLRAAQADPGALAAAARTAAATLGQAADLAGGLAGAVDEAAYAALPGDVRTRVDAVAHETRTALGQALLLGQTPRDPDQPAPGALVEALGETYAVLAYTFASAPAETDLATWIRTGDPARAAAPQDAPAPADPAEEPPDEAAPAEGTDLAAALQRVMSDTAGKELAGVVLVTDGRHTGRARLEPVARQLGLQGVPVSSVVLGSERPPRDAGILSVSAPETVYAEDKVHVAAELKLDGLKGQEVEVVLADAGETVDTRTVRVPTDSYRTRVEFGHEPEAPGVHHYRVTLPAFEDEVDAANNVHPLNVHVTEDQTKLLIVEGRPRWEFRYLKNLFADRDRSVYLQYVLFHPDQVEGAPRRKVVPASVAREEADAEANALPETEAEWLKFDVIVLGDVDPEDLGEADREALARFVTERGGTLIVIAGPHHMPHAFADDERLADLLPVAVEASDEPVLEPPEMRFRLGLTPEGRLDVIMRQKPDPDENLAVWDAVPAVYWRHPIEDVKAGATVLAYAVPEDAPGPPEAAADDPSGGAGAAAAQADRMRDFIRKHALILHHRVALGRVMFLAFDRTWRLRYRVGDTYHHRFWGQVLRWATAGKLPAGTEHVKLGTDRVRYAPGETVRVQAKLVDEAFEPIESDAVGAAVYEGDRLVLRRPLAFVPKSPGLYEGDLGTLGGGVYRVELEAPAAADVLAADGRSAVEWTFSVDPKVTSEMAELTPDRGLLGRLATLSRGAVVDPGRAASVVETLGPGNVVEIEKHELVLWDSWPVLVLVLAMGAGEWLLRKKAGLA